MRKSRLLSINWKLLIIVLSFTISVVEAREIKAKLTWFNITKLSFRVNGIVTNLHVKPGDYIKKKQKLISLDQREYIDTVSLTKSLKKSRKSEFDEAKRELDRAVELFDRTVLSEHELQSIKNNYIASETHYITAKTNWLTAKRDLEFSNITAPFNAIILEVSVNKNETVVSSFQASPAVIIADGDKISAQFSLKANEVVKLKSGETVEVIINGSNYKGELFFPSLLALDKLYPVGVLLSIPYGVVRSGMDATVILH